MQDAWRLPPHAVVIWRNLQDDEDPVPTVSFYSDVREDLDMEPLPEESQITNSTNKKLMKQTTNNTNTQVEENAESSGRQEVQVEQALAGGKGSLARNRRRPASRARN